MWKSLAILVVMTLFPVSAVAHTKLFYRMSYRSDYRKVEVTSTPEPMVTPEPTEVLTSTPVTTEQISTSSDVDTQTTPAALL